VAVVANLARASEQERIAFGLTAWMDRATPKGIGPG